MSQQTSSIDFNTSKQRWQNTGNCANKFLLTMQREKVRTELAAHNGELSIVDPKLHSQLSSLLQGIEETLNSVSITMEDVSTLLCQMVERDELSYRDMDMLSGAKAALVRLSKMRCSYTARTVIDDIISYHENKQCKPSQSKELLASITARVKYINNTVN